MLTSAFLYKTGEPRRVNPHPPPPPSPLFLIIKLFCYLEKNHYICFFMSLVDKSPFPNRKYIFLHGW